MAGANGTATEPLTGVVSAVNERGIKIGGQWVNWSRWAKDRPDLEAGQTVALTLDGQGWIRSAEIVTAPTPAHTGTPYEINEIDEISPPAPVCSAHITTRERHIIRQCALESAARFAAGRSEIKSGDVLMIAASWEGWIARTTG